MTRRYRRPNSRPRVLLMVENVALGRDHRLRKQVRALLAEGYSVSVICRADPANNRVEGIDLYDYAAPVDARSRHGFLREYSYSWLMAAALTLKVFWLTGFDAIQVSGTPDIYFAIGAPFGLLGRALVLDQRDLSPELYERRYHRRDRMYRLLRRLERASYRSADHVITVNRSLRQIVCRRGNLDVESVSIVGNGPCLDRADDFVAVPELRRGRRLLACWVGLMGPQDEVDLALRAIHQLATARRRSDCHFAFIGDGEARAASIALARELGIEDLVSFPGWLDESEVFRYLASADLGLEPNLEPTVSPVKGMEYMAFSLPFVAFDLPETRAVADAAAIYVRPGDTVAFAGAIEELLDDPAQRRERGRVGRERIERQLAWEHQERTYLDVYRTLLRPAAEAPAGVGTPSPLPGVVR